MDYTKSTLVNKSNVYKCCDNYHSKYDELVGMYFKVIAIHNHPKATEISSLYSDKYYFELEEKESGDKVYFEYHSKYESSFPFLVVGFYTKLKEQSLGEKFVIGDTKTYFEDNTLDFKTGNPIVFGIGNKWECIDVTIEEKYFSLCLVLEDEKGQTIKVSYESIVGPKKHSRFFTEEDANRYKIKFGTSIWNLILKGEVKIGMTKEMCRLSWGKPNDINKTVSSGYNSEQWVYSDNYLYFDGNILKTIQ